MSFVGKILPDDDDKFALLNGLLPEYYVKTTIVQENLVDTFENMVASLEITEE